MSGMNFIYNTFLRRSSTYALTIIGGVFIFERVFDQGADYLFEYINRGKLFKHIKPAEEK